LDIQGHRGCRGLMPENTLAAFEEAIKLNVTTLELDVVISKDAQVVVSHEPWFNWEITTSPEGNFISKEEGHQLNIFQMNYADIKKFDVGNKIHPRFNVQKNQKQFKPLLSDVITASESWCLQRKRTPVNYSIEIKSTIEDEDSLYQPNVQTFCELVMKQVQKHGIEARCTIQSFDVRVLNYMHMHFPNQALAYLVENESDYAHALTLLNFKPTVYSCDFTLLNKMVVDELHRNEIKVIPWTVNEAADIKNMLALGVDGIISDYPDRVIALEKK